MPSTLRNRLSRLLIGDDYSSAALVDTSVQQRKPSSATTTDSGFWSGTSSRSRSPDRLPTQQISSHATLAESKTSDAESRQSLHRFASKTFKAISENIRSKAQIFYVDPNSQETQLTVEGASSGKHEHMTRIMSSLRNRNSRNKLNEDLPDGVIPDTPIPEIPHEIHIEIPDSKLVDADIGPSNRDLALKGSLGSMSALPKSLYTERSSSLAAQTSINCALESMGDILHSTTASGNKENPGSLHAKTEGKRSHTAGNLFVKGNREYPKRHGVPSPYRRALLLSDETGLVSATDRSDDDQAPYTEQCGANAPIRLPLSLTTSFSSGLSDIMMVTADTIDTPDTVDIAASQLETYDADAESSSELSEAPSMGPRSSWDKARADRQRRYQVVRTMSAETAADHSDDSGLELSSFSGRSQPVSADAAVTRSTLPTHATGRKVHFETTTLSSELSEENKSQVLHESKNTESNVETSRAPTLLRLKYSFEGIDQLGGPDHERCCNDWEEPETDPEVVDGLWTEPRSMLFRDLACVTETGLTRRTKPARLKQQSRKSSMLSDSTSSSCAITTSSPLCYQPNREPSYHVHTHHVRRTSSINEKIGHTFDDVKSEISPLTMLEATCSGSPSSLEVRASTLPENESLESSLVTEAYAHSFHGTKNVASWSPWLIDQVPLIEGLEVPSVPHKDVRRFTNVAGARQKDVSMDNEFIHATQTTPQQQAQELRSSGPGSEDQPPPNTRSEALGQVIDSPCLEGARNGASVYKTAPSTPSWDSQSEVLPPLPASSNTPYHETSLDCQQHIMSGGSTVNPEHIVCCITSTDNHQTTTTQVDSILPEIMSPVRPISVDFSVLNPEVGHYLAQAFSNASFIATESEYSDEDEGFRTPIATPSKRERRLEDCLETPKPQSLSHTVERVLTPELCMVSKSEDVCVASHTPRATSLKRDRKLEGGLESPTPRPLSHTAEYISTPESCVVMKTEEGFVAARLPHFGTSSQVHIVGVADLIPSTLPSSGTTHLEQGIERIEWTPSSRRPSSGGHRREQSWQMRESSHSGEEFTYHSVGAPKLPLQTSSLKKGVWWTRDKKLHRNSESPCEDRKTDKDHGAEQDIEKRALQIIDTCIDQNTRLSEEVRAYSNEVQALLATAHIFGGENSHASSTEHAQNGEVEASAIAKKEFKMEDEHVATPENYCSAWKAAEEQEQDHDSGRPVDFFSPSPFTSLSASQQEEVEAPMESGQVEEMVGMDGEPAYTSASMSPRTCVANWYDEEDWIV